MNIRPAVAGWALALAVGVGADMRQDFNVAYQAYREAMAGGRYDAALEPAAKVRELGETLYADDLSGMATLVFNHGFVLGKLKRHDEAYPILKEARKLMRAAFGNGAKEMLNVEMALLASAPPSGVRHYMEEALELAGMHHGGNSKLTADIKLQGALRLWGKDAISLLEEASAGYQAAGDANAHAVAQFWIGKKHFVRRDYAKVPKPLNAAIEALPERHQLALMAERISWKSMKDSDRATGRPSIAWRLVERGLGQAMPTTSRCSNGRRNTRAARSRVMPRVWSYSNSPWTRWASSGTRRLSIRKASRPSMNLHSKPRGDSAMRPALSMARPSPSRRSGTGSSSRCASRRCS